MAVLKCKMCGGDLHFEPGEPIAVCEYCLSRQTIPHQDDEKKLTLFARADRLRRACEFDKAAGIYANITGEFPEEAEAYWGLVLCNYGIEYVDDPATGKKIPTCHRSSFVSILEDSDFEQACENADPAARRVYREEAKTIENIRRGILEISGKEEPYDIFICYKETDENGERTVDSVLAQDVYDALTEKGYRVFFSRVTLETVLGAQYEPYIFAALNSARIMLVFGTDYEYFNAVWVKNEWSRFLAHIASGQKKALIPCYKGIDPYDMPKEFVRLQAQDMGKVGALQDLLRGVDKIMGGGAEKAAAREQEIPRADSSAGVSQLIQRGYFCLEDQDWEKARELFDQALNLDPKCADAYFGLAMADNSSPTRESFGEKYVKGQIAADAKNIKRARQFADPKLKALLMDLEQKRQEAEETKRAHLKFHLSQRREELKIASLMIAGNNDTVGLNADGTVVNTWQSPVSKRDVSNWENIVAVFAGELNTVGLKDDGTVVVTGDNNNGQYEATEWKDIETLSVGEYHIVGVKTDGSITVAGMKDTNWCHTDEWTNIKAVSAGDKGTTIGLKNDGTVVATGDNRYGRCDVSEWTDIVEVSIGKWHTVGLTAYGTVVAAGSNYQGQCNVGDWTNIVQVTAGEWHTVGLKADGTVVAAGNNKDGQCDLREWNDIVSIDAGCDYSIGLKADGTVLAKGTNVLDNCMVSNWKLFDSIETLPKEITKEYREIKEKCAALQRELLYLPLIFSGKRRREIEAQLAELEQDLSEL